MPVKGFGLLPIDRVRSFGENDELGMWNMDELAAHDRRQVGTEKGQVTRTHDAMVAAGGVASAQPSTGRWSAVTALGLAPLGQ